MRKTMLEYMTADLVSRQAHLNLDEECIEIGGNSLQYRGLLAHFLNTFIPSKPREALLCHACHNARCSNPRHLYWGTYSENLKDSFKAGRKSPYYYISEKNGEEAAKTNVSNAGKRKRGTTHKAT